MSALAPAYRPRRPTETVLYRVVRAHLETFLAYARETYDAPLPRYVEKELRGYLRCGVFAHGFVRARCDACGHDLLVAFSCKARGACPSCAGRRMANTAAHLVDRVLPAVPVRQWVLSLPFELRALAAFRADVLAALSRMFVEAVFDRLRARAKRDGVEGALCGAVTFVQRFGSSLNLNVHFHVVVLDGVFARDERARLVFHPAASPTHADLDAVARRVHRRAVAWLARRGRLADPPDDDSATPIDACAAIAMKRGGVHALRDEPGASEASPSEPTPPPRRDAADHEGFNVNASVAMAADDDLGRELLCRYGARPPLSLDRLRFVPGGRVAYRVKKLRDGRAKQRVMTPLEVLARVAALVPPPRYPLVRYHGVLAPRSSWRREVVPKPRVAEAEAAPRETRGPESCPPTKATGHVAGRASRSPRAGSKSDTQSAQRPDTPTPPVTSHLRAPASADPNARAKPLVEVLAPNVLSTRHWARLLGGRLFAASPRVDWATLLRRTFDVDVLQCPKCEGRLRVLAAVTDLAMARMVLEALGLPADAPRAARARDPTELLAESPD